VSLKYVYMTRLLKTKSFLLYCSVRFVAKEQGTDKRLGNLTREKFEGGYVYMLIALYMGYLSFLCFLYVLLESLCLTLASDWAIVCPSDDR